MISTNFIMNCARPCCAYVHRVRESIWRWKGRITNLDKWRFFTYTTVMSSLIGRTTAISILDYQWNAGSRNYKRMIVWWSRWPITAGCGKVLQWAGGGGGGAAGGGGAGGGRRRGPAGRGQ